MKEKYLVHKSRERMMSFHFSIFEQRNARTIRNVAMRTQGNQGPTGLDANE